MALQELTIKDSIRFASTTKNGFYDNTNICIKIVERNTLQKAVNKDRNSGQNLTKTRKFHAAG